MEAGVNLAKLPTVNDTALINKIDEDGAINLNKAGITGAEIISAASGDEKKTSEISLLAEGISKIMTTNVLPSIAKAPTKSTCNYPFCDTVNGDVLVCGECSAGVHYKCSKLPAYQIRRFVTARNYRKYVCESCCGDGRRLLNVLNRPVIRCAYS